MLGNPAGPGGPAQRGLWPLAPVPIPNAANYSADSAYNKYGLYSFLSSSPSFGSALYSHSAAIGRFATGSMQAATGTAFHDGHKDALFSSAGYTFGSPTPPPGSPYSPVPMAHLEVLAKGFNSGIVLQQQQQQAACGIEKCCQKGCCTCAKPKLAAVVSGCSRTNPLDWNVLPIKKEPATPCQVAEVTTSNSALSATIKVEAASPTHDACPMGIAVARRAALQQEVIATPALPSIATAAGLLTTTVNAAQLREPAARMSDLDVAGLATASNVPGATASLLQCAASHCADDRAAIGGYPTWPVSGAVHNSTLTTPTLWQYPAHLPMEPIVPMSVPIPPVGFQLVRDHNTGGYLLLPATSVVGSSSGESNSFLLLEQVQQVLWPSYHQPSSHVLLPPSIPPPPLQLLSASSDFLQTSTTLHQHTQTQSTRLLAVTTDKRKLPLPTIPATTLIKIESDVEQHKALQAVSAFDNGSGTAVYTDPNANPLLATHVIYQHPTNLILSQTSAESSSVPNTTTTTTASRSQATSPVACLTPPPDSNPSDESSPTDGFDIDIDVGVGVGVQDASNQTEAPDADAQEEGRTPKDEVQKSPSSPSVCVPDLIQSQLTPTRETSCLGGDSPSRVDADEQLLHVDEPNVVNVRHSIDKPCDAEMPPAAKPTPEPDLFGLHLLSNSVLEYERIQQNKSSMITHESNDDVLAGIAQMTLSDKPVSSSSSSVKKEDVGALQMLCVLAEQRFLEELTDGGGHLKRDAAHPASANADKASDNSVKTCICKEDSYRTYKTKESEQEAKKYLASKSQTMFCSGDWPCMNAMELDMRMRLADLQRKYREKQKELSRLKLKSHRERDKMIVERKCAKVRKKSSSECFDSEATLADVVTRRSCAKSLEILKPPVLGSFSSSHQEAITTASLKRPLSDTDDGGDLTLKSSKKRKVGRPKKLLATSGIQLNTETIVAKKPRKGNLVGFLLAAKEKLIQNNTALFDPQRFIEDDSHDVSAPSDQVVKDVIIVEEEEEEECKEKNVTFEEKCSKPEEAKIEQDCGNIEASHKSNGVAPQVLCPYNEELGEAAVASSSSHAAQSENTEVLQFAETQSNVVDSKCTLSTDHLNSEKLRVLTAMGGLFYAGRLNAVEPPDVYSITLDGERGNRPHIMSREEILRDAIVEVSPTTSNDLPPGTRLCAYWSQQYRCLYPGSVAEPESPNSELDEKFVSVEFDDGDSGRIAIEDIRLLPTGYPIIEYDPNPLLSLCKKRRRISSVEERRPAIIKPPTPAPPTPPPPLEIAEEVKRSEKENIDANKQLMHKERKKLKKKKRDRANRKLNEGKKCRRKHKCAEENCRHRKHHKKHRKHKKHHRVEADVSSKANKAKMDVDDERSETARPTTYCTDVLSTEVECPAYHIVPNVDEVAPTDEAQVAKSTRNKKIRDRQESCESRSKMSAFLPARQLWGWSGKCYRRPKTKGRTRKQFYRAIQRGKETIQVGDSAVFLSTGRPDRPYIGKIEAMWEACGTMVVKVKWFYHPEETVGCPPSLKYPGALFESPHVDENDVQTISHKCEVLPLKDYTNKLGDDPKRYATIYDNNDIYYLAGYYDPTSAALKMEADIPVNKHVD